MFTPLVDFIISMLFISSAGFLVYYFKIYFPEKIKASIKNEYDRELEKLRGELVTNNTILNTVLTAQNQGYQLAQNERISAIKTFWDRYLTVRQSLSEIGICDLSLPESEFNKLYTKDWTGNGITENILQNYPYAEKINLIIESVSEVDKLRPFLNENLWMSFSFLQIFSARILYLYQIGNKDKKIIHWKNDTALLELMRKFLTDIEYSYINKINIASIRSVQNFIEQKILLEITEIITGKVAAIDTFTHAMQLVENDKKSTDLKSYR